MGYSLQEFQSIKMYHCAYQGPCPRGFHIGSKDEWQSLINSLTRLGVYNVSNITTVLKIPSAYYLARSNGSKEKRYGICRFWTSTMTSNTVAWVWGISEDNALLFQEDKPGNAFSIRPFKDNPTIPESDWTILYRGPGSAGIFWNSTLGLISISGNGTTWTTMTDKNLGATNVGDDGLYYQFGNNYGFTVNPTPYYTSKVSNTQAYGPSNYYDDEHFVRVSSGNNWFTDTNNNIRGGVDTTSLYPTEAKEVWLGNHKVRPSGWQPGANTIAYYPLNSTDTVNDKSGNNRNLTYNTLSFGTYQGVDCAYGNQAVATLSTNLGTFTTMTLSIYAYNGNSSDRYFCSIGGNGNLDITSHKATYYYNSGYNFNLNDYKQGSRQHLCVVFNNRTVYLYQNGALIRSGGVNGDIVITSGFGVGTNSNGNAPSSQRLIGGVSNFIIENKARTAQEITDYYNLTKGDYGIS